MTAPDPAMAEISLAEALARFEEQGYVEQMAARPGGLVVCFSCHQEAPARDVVLEALVRIEGASDPADEVAVAAVVCPCGARGTLTLHYGPEAAPEEAEVLRELEDQRARDPGPPRAD